MDEQLVRERAQALCDALVAGDVDRAIGDFSPELQRNLGEVIALLPLPATAATIESAEQSGGGWTVVIRMVGETDSVDIQTRWKERDGAPAVVEASHVATTPTAAPTDGGEADADEGSSAAGG
jgi:hypothetical protein